MFSEKIASDSKMVEQIMAEVDKNQDEFISYDEFNSALTSILKGTQF